MLDLVETFSGRGLVSFLDRAQQLLRGLQSPAFGAEELDRRISNADASYYLGNLEDGWFVVEEGLRGGELVVVTGHARLKTGTKVRVAD